jgi:hypothetical protein
VKERCVSSKLLGSNLNKREVRPNKVPWGGVQSSEVLSLELGRFQSHLRRLRMDNNGQTGERQDCPELPARNCRIGYEKTNSETLIAHWAAVCETEKACLNWLMNGYKGSRGA